MPEAHPYKNSKPVFENRPELLLDSPYPLLVGELVTIDLLSNRPVDQVVVADLPPGLSLSSDQKSIAGTPTAVGSFVSTIETSNAAGSISKSMIFEIKDFSPWIYSASIDFQAMGKRMSFRIFPFIWS